MEIELLIIPGLGDSGENHWQSYWLKKYKNATKVVQDNWDKPQREDWLSKRSFTTAALLRRAVRFITSYCSPTASMAADP